MRKSTLAIATAALAAATLQTSAAEARGLRIGIGLGIGIGLPLAIHGAHAYHSRPRTETVVNGRYRCCSEHRHVERHVVVRPAKAPPRVKHVERVVKVERPERGIHKEMQKATRKKPVKAPPAEVIMVQAPASSQGAVKPMQMADNGHRATIQQPAAAVAAVAGMSVPVGLTAAAVPPVAPSSSVTTAGGQGPEALTAMTGAPNHAARLDTAGQVAPDAASAAGSGDLNCRRYVPSLGKTVAVSCME